jgi:FkbM family methyltransferase
MNTKIIRKSLNLMHRLLNGIGLDVVKVRNAPSYTWMGLKDMRIQRIVDVGANRGQFMESALSAFPDAVFYCFEPLPAAFSVLESNVKIRNAGKVNLYNMAVGDTEGTIDMHLHVDHDVSSSLLLTTQSTAQLYPVTNSQRVIQVPITTLDSALNIPRVQQERDLLVKIDVQGYEDRVIKGGAQTIGRAKAVIIEINVESLYEGQPEFVDLALQLKRLGLRYAGNMRQSYAPDGRVVFLDAIFVAYQQ